MVMVPKPDSTLCFYNDFCRLNEVSEYDGYPMPCVDELQDCLKRARYISTLNLTKGYWQVSLSEGTKPKTAFPTLSEQWQYRTLPFGLHGALATFQRMMNSHQAYAAIYLNDMVINSETLEDHLDNLRRVLSELVSLHSLRQSTWVSRWQEDSYNHRRKRWKLSDQPLGLNRKSKEKLCHSGKESPNHQVGSSVAAALSPGP